MKAAWFPRGSCALLFFALATRGEISTTNEPVPGIFIHSETRLNPPTRLYVALVDLKNPKLHLHVAPGGPDPDGPGKWQTTLMEPTRIAAREHFDFVINGDFFIARGANDGEGSHSPFRAGQWAMTEGPAMTDGKAWSASKEARPVLIVHKHGEVTIDTIREPAGDDREVVSGNRILVHDGMVLTSTNKTRHPRTVVGLDASLNQLTILVVDGRKPGIADGMNYDELAAEMVHLGCTEALNLDGGGSSLMAARKPATGKLEILNEPTDGHERAVANVLGISAGSE